MYSETQGRLVSLDIIKLISAFMIVFYHCSDVFLGTFENGVYSISAGQILSIPCSASVPLFFMANGAILLNKEYSLGKVYSKAAKLALIIFVWSILNFPSWFLETLIVIYLIYPVLKKVYQKPVARYALMAGIFAITFLFNLLILMWRVCIPDFAFEIFGREISLSFLPGRTGFFRMYSIVYFFLGGMLFKKKTNLTVSMICILSGFVLVYFDVVATSNYTSEIADAVNACFPTVGALLMAVGFFNLSSYFDVISCEKFRKIVIWGSDCVLPIYLFHIFIRYKILSHVINYSSGSWLLGFAVSVLVYIICIVSAKIIKKIPLARELIKI